MFIFVFSSIELNKNISLLQIHQAQCIFSFTFTILHSNEHELPFLQTQTFWEQFRSSEEIFWTVKVNWRTNRPINFVVFLMFPLVFSWLPHHTLISPRSSFYKHALLCEML